jgi:hypothetical protein
MPTERGRRWMELSDEIVQEIEHRYAAAVGRREYAAFFRTLKVITADGSQR